MDTANTTDLHDEMIRLGKAARSAMQELGSVPTEAKDRALRGAAASIRASKDVLKAANQKDMDAAEAKGTTGAMLDRLLLTDVIMPLQLQEMQGLQQTRLRQL